MRVRHVVSAKKTLISDTLWSVGDMPPRYAPIYARTKPIRAGWKWRSARLRTAYGDMILTAECNPARDNWKAVLIRETEQGASVVARFESHGSHPGLHVHAHCSRSGIEIGPTSLDDLARVPGNHRPHRRQNGWTEATFWEAAIRFFRIELDAGPLFNYAR